MFCLFMAFWEKMYAKIDGMRKPDRLHKSHLESFFNIIVWIMSRNNRGVYLDKQGVSPLKKKESFRR